MVSRDHVVSLAVVALFSCDDSAIIRHVLPVLWMTSCFHIMGHVSIKIISHNFPRYSPGGARSLFDFVIVYDGSKLSTRGQSVLSLIALLKCCGLKCCTLNTNPVQAYMTVYRYRARCEQCLIQLQLITGDLICWLVIGAWRAI